MQGEADATAVAAVVLAGGSSTRMGHNKLLLRVDGESLIVRAVRRAAAAGLDPVVVVLGHEAERVESELDGLTCRMVVNADHASGQASSFRAGIGALPIGTPAAVVLLPDMPGVTTEMIAAVVACYRRTRATLVVSEYGGTPAPPTLYDGSLFEEIRSGAALGREVVRRHRGQAQIVAWPADRLTDLDEPGDVARLRSGVSPG